MTATPPPHTDTPRRRPTASRFALMLVAALSLSSAAGCGASSLYGDSNGTVRGAVDALRRSNADPLEPDRVDELGAALVRGLLRGAGNHDTLQGLLHDTVEDVVRGLREELQRAIAAILVALDASLTGDGAQAHGILRRALADLDPQLMRTVHGLRRELAGTAGDLRGTVAGVEDDLARRIGPDGGLGDSLRGTVRATVHDSLAEVNGVVPQLGRDVRSDLDPALSQMAQHVGDGLMRGVSGRAYELVDKLKDRLEDRKTRFLIIVLVAIVGAGQVAWLAMMARFLRSTLKVVSDFSTTFERLSGALEALKPPAGGAPPAPTDPGGAPAPTGGGGGEPTQRRRFGARRAMRPTRFRRRGPPSAMAALLLVALSVFGRRAEAQSSDDAQRWLQVPGSAQLEPLVLVGTDGLAVAPSRAVSDLGEGCVRDLGFGRRERALVLAVEPGNPVALLRIINAADERSMRGAPEGFPLVARMPDPGAVLRVLFVDQRGAVIRRDADLERSDAQRMVLRLREAPPPNARPGAVLDDAGWLAGLAISSDGVDASGASRVVAVGGAPIRALLSTTRRSQGYPACHAVFARSRFGFHHVGFGGRVNFATADASSTGYGVFAQVSAFDDIFVHLDVGYAPGDARVPHRMLTSLGGGAVLGHNLRDGMIAVGARLDLEWQFDAARKAIQREAYLAELHGAAYAGRRVAITIAVTAGVQRERVATLADPVLGASIGLELGLAWRLSDPDPLERAP
ncbi:MAG: hypothetical protein U0326_31585 [Polyangiales bacterium]